MEIKSKARAAGPEAPADSKKVVTLSIPSGADADLAAGGCSSTMDTAGIPRIPTQLASEAPAFSSEDLQKWARMSNQGFLAFRKKHPDKFQRRVCRGIPSQHRWAAWKATVGLEARIQPGRYGELCALDSTWAQLINVDVPRTFPDISVFGEDYRNSLRKILLAYSNLNTEVGYCQGMNFVVGLLLLVSSREEEEAFWMFTYLMEVRRLSGFYKEKFPLLHKYLAAMTQLMDREIPELCQHFSREGLQPSDYMQQWFLTLFINCLPMPTVLIIWDGLICNGVHILLSTSVALLQSVRHILLTMPFEDIMSFFRMMRVSQDNNDAVRIGQLLMRRSMHIDVPASIRQQLKSSSASKTSTA